MSTPPRVTRRRPADPDHEVITVEGGRGYRRQPCAGCPWRTDQTGQFPPEAFALSAETAYDQARHAFGCHERPVDNPATCAGFLLRGAEHNLAVRMALASGRINLDTVTDGGHQLHDDYRTMAVANGLPADHPRLKDCR